MAEIQVKCMRQVLGVSSSFEAVKKICTDREKTMAIMKEHMHPCLMDEFENNKPSPEQMEMMKKMQAMDPEKRKATMKAGAKKIMQCKLKALST